jgi:dTDP-4-dehydrorhamnose reductase
VSWAEFAQTIFRHQGISCHVKTITTKEYGARASRPLYSVLNCDKIAALLSDPIPHWEDALQRYLLLV